MHNLGDTYTDSKGIVWIVTWVAPDGSGFESRRV